MHIVAGTLKAKMPNGDWKSYVKGQFFVVPPKVKFEVEASRRCGLPLLLQTLKPDSNPNQPPDENDFVWRVFFGGAAPSRLSLVGRASPRAEGGKISCYLSASA